MSIKKDPVVSILEAILEAIAIGALLASVFFASEEKNKDKEK